MKEITAITAQKNNKTRVNLYLDGRFFCGAELMTVMKLRLKAGQKISEEDLEKILYEEEYTSALDRATRYISAGMHTKNELKKYLSRKKYSDKIIDAVVGKLGEYGYVDDNFYAEQFVELKKKANGKRKIAYELKQKGVDNGIIDEVLNSVIDESEACYKAAEKYFKGKKADLKLKQSAYRYLVGKGFDYETVKEALKKFYDEDDFS